jgi:hypothetical protein
MNFADCYKFCLPACGLVIFADNIHGFDEATIMADDVRGIFLQHPTPPSWRREAMEHLTVTDGAKDGAVIETIVARRLPGILVNTAHIAKSLTEPRPASLKCSSAFDGVRANIEQN